jgi:HlyD family secretion protein/adhesin transport system membrane fusion protein
MVRIAMQDALNLRLFDQRVAQPLELEDGRPPGLRSATLYVISFATIGVVLWAAIAEVREIAVASGELTPTGKIQSVQHFDGGIVEEVLVKAGSHVKAGDAIIRLKPRLVSSDFNQLRGRMAWLELEEARLYAEQSGDRPNFNAQSTEYPDLVLRQEQTYTANMQERATIVAALDMRIAALQAQVAALVREIEDLQAESETHREMFIMQRDLAEKGRTPRRVLLEAKASFQRASTALAAAAVQLAETKKDLADAVGEKERTGAKTQKDLADQRAKNIEQRLELTHQLDKLSDRYDRLLVRAPVDGFVKEVMPKGAGSVIQPGQLIAEIVPKGQNLFAEVKIQPRDVGHIKAGDPAELEVTTFDVNVQGKIKGKVTNVSASSFKSETGEPYFRGEISFDMAAQEDPIGRVTLIPGMVVEANIITGSKSILRYLLKPIYRSIDRAFTER